MELIHFGLPKLTSENIRGSEPKIAILNQDNAVNKKACCKLNFLSWSRLDKKNRVPKIIVIIEAPKKEESISLKKNWTNIGINIKIPRIIWRIPRVKKTVL